jgi:hypothetical protein
VVAAVGLAITDQPAVAHLGDLHGRLGHAPVARAELGDDALLGRRARAEEVDAAADVAQVVGGVVDGVAQDPPGVDLVPVRDSGPAPLGGVVVTDRERPALEALDVLREPLDGGSRPAARVGGSLRWRADP